MMLDEPLNVAEVPVLPFAPAVPNVTSVTVLAVKRSVRMNYHQNQVGNAR